MTLFIEALSGVMDTALLYLFASGFFTKYRSEKVFSKYFVFCFAILIISCAPLTGIIRMTICWIAISTFLFATYKSTISHAILISTAFATISALSDIVCEYPFFFLGLSRERILTEGLARCIFIILAKITNSFVIILLVACFGKKRLLDIPLRELFPLATCQFFSAFICIVSLELVDKVSHFLLLLLTFSVIGILYINIVFFAYMQFIRTNYENEQRRRLAEQQLQSQLAYYQQVKITNEQTRSMWHDIQKQLTAVTSLMANNNMAQASASLKQITQSFREINRIVDVDHPVVNAILNDALQKAQSAGIKIQMDVFISPQLSLSPLALSIVLGNTLDNAVNACSGITDTSVKKVIELTLRQKAGILYYRLSNPYGPVFSKKKRQGIHGYGLKNVTECIEQNGGTILIGQTENQYTVEIIFSL